MKIKVGMVRTIQTKLYESIRIEVSVEDERDLGGADSSENTKVRDVMYKRLSKFVRERIEEEEDRWL